MSTIQYILPVGTRVYRFKADDGPEEFITTREVHYGAADLMREYTDLQGVTIWYTFRLPIEARPWVKVEVNVAAVQHVGNSAKNNEHEYKYTYISNKYKNKYKNKYEYKNKNEYINMPKISKTIGGWGVKPA